MLQNAEQLFDDGDGSDWGCGDKEVSTASYESAREEFVKNYDEVVELV